MISDFVKEKKGNNIVRGVVSSILTLALGTVMLGFFFEVGDDLGLTGTANTTYNQIKTKGFTILYMVIIVPIALVVGAILTLV